MQKHCLAAAEVTVDTTPKKPKNKIFRSKVSRSSQSFEDSRSFSSPEKMGRCDELNNFINLLSTCSMYPKPNGRTPSHSTALHFLSHFTEIVDSLTDISNFKLENKNTLFTVTIRNFQDFVYLEKCIEIFPQIQNTL